MQYQDKTVVDINENLQSLAGVADQMLITLEQIKEQEKVHTSNENNISNETIELFDYDWLSDGDEDV